MKKLLSLPVILISHFLLAQNVGIGTSNPEAKLHIRSTTEEVVRIDANNPYLSLYSNGEYKGYLWKSPNSIELGTATYSNLPITLAPNGVQQMFILPNGNVGIGTATPSKKLHVEGLTFLNGPVGIQNNNPNAPLAFPPILGKKITLYPGVTGDAGFAISGNRLQIYSDNPNADVAIGYDAAGIFNERFTIKPNGALAINGTTGNTGQILQSGGNGAAYWANKPMALIFNQTSGVTLENPNLSEFLPGLNGQYFTLEQTSTISIQGSFYLAGAFNSIPTGWFLIDILNWANNTVYRSQAAYTIGDNNQTVILMGSVVLNTGTYQIRATVNRTSTAGRTYVFGLGSTSSIQGSQLFLQIFPY